MKQTQNTDSNVEGELRLKLNCVVTSSSLIKSVNQHFAVQMQNISNTANKISWIYYSFIHRGWFYFSSALLRCFGPWRWSEPLWKLLKTIWGVWAFWLRVLAFHVLSLTLTISSCGSLFLSRTKGHSSWFWMPRPSKSWEEPTCLLTWLMASTVPSVPLHELQNKE